MANGYSKYACTSGLREVTDPLINHGKRAAGEIIRAMAEDLDNAGPEFDSALVRVFAALKDGLANPEGDYFRDEAVAALFTFAADALDAVCLESTDYLNPLELVGDALDDYIDSECDRAFSDGQDEGSESSYSDGYSEGYRVAEEEAKDARASRDEEYAACPTCRAPALERDTLDAFACRCGHCASEWRLIDVRVPFVTANGDARTPEHAPETREEYARACGLESGPLTAKEER